ncbi:MAG: HAMP domain-containing histidine kinase [Pseudomonadales bacterium]|nr:HAMP domain-containing histidine kinase [Pseudomonadales bacterium]NRA14694.1 HAMP domain-containing histidine kinase [Oceanospirillaceae bacterium]
MFRLNTLFWKVFISLWLSSFMVMMVTVVVIGELAEEDNYKSKAKFQVRLQVERFLERYEGNPKYRQRIQQLHQNVNQHREGRWPMQRPGMPPIQIYDHQGRQILGGEQPPGEKIQLQVTSISGQDYQVAYFIKPPRNSLARWQGFILSVQALLILLSSTIASFIVSAIVVRPMNKLRQYVQRLKSGEFSVRIADKLLGRGDEIGDFAREFNQLAEYVENTLIGQQQLFQNVSHELRAPLARLMAASGIVEQQIGEGHPAVNRIQMECQRLSLLIDELLSLAKLQQQEHVCSSIEVSALLDKLLADIRFSQGQRQIELQVADTVNTQALGSVPLLERALGNVLGNSLKHTSTETNISVRLVNPDADSLQIIVEDNGPGVPEDALAKLCDPFFRLDTNVDGHGLGLGIARQAMQGLQGGLQVQNVEPSGLRVTLSMRLAK